MYGQHGPQFVHPRMVLRHDDVDDGDDAALPAIAQQFGQFLGADGRAWRTARPNRTPSGRRSNRGGFGRCRTPALAPKTWMYRRSSPSTSRITVLLVGCESRRWTCPQPTPAACQALQEHFRRRVGADAAADVDGECPAWPGRSPRWPRNRRPSRASGRWPAIRPPAAAASSARKTCRPPGFPRNHVPPCWCPPASDSATCWVDAFSRLVGERLDQFRLGLEEIVGRAKDIRAVAARRLEAAADLGPRLRRPCSP